MDAPVGILMLATRFPRPLGDIGHPASWPCRVMFRTVEGATPRRVARERARGLLDRFIEAGRALVAEGAGLITTSCGFMVLQQRDLAAALPVPVATSSLLRIPRIQATLPRGKRVGVLTIEAASLSPDHLAAAGADPATPVVGTDSGREFTRRILNDEPMLDRALAERDIVEAGLTLVREHPEVGTIVLECTNMGPYADALRKSVKLPVWDIVESITRAG